MLTLPADVARCRGRTWADDEFLADECQTCKRWVAHYCHEARDGLVAYTEPPTEPKRKTDVKPFNELIIAARGLKNETLDTAANNMGIAKSQLWSMEKGETEPKLQMLQKMLRYYGIAFEQISDV